MKRKLWIILALAALITALGCGTAMATNYAGYCGADSSVDGRNLTWGDRLTEACLSDWSSSKAPLTR